MEHSKNFKKVKDYYDDKLWDKRRVRLAVGRWITAEQGKITSNVRAANTIYPTNLHECEMRRDYQNTAIVNCEQLH